MGIVNSKKIKRSCADGLFLGALSLAMCAAFELAISGSGVSPDFRLQAAIVFGLTNSAVCFIGHSVAACAVYKNLIGIAYGLIAGLVSLGVYSLGVAFIGFLTVLALIT